MESYRASNVEVQIGLRLIAPEGKPVHVCATLRYAGSDPYAVHVVFHIERSGANSRPNVPISETAAINPIVQTISASNTSTQELESEIVWSFSRELLTDGLRIPSGYGDVRVLPWNGKGRSCVGLALSSPDGYALFEAPRLVVEQFLNRSYNCVPAGTEEQYLDVDSSLAHLLGTPDAGAH